MHPSVLLSTLLLSSLTQATPLHTPRADYAVHERRIEHPAWIQTRRLEGNATLPLRIGLKQRNLDLLPDYLMSVSDPSSLSFGQHWTPDKVVETFAPASEAVDRVHAWLVNAGFEERRVRRSANRAWVEVMDATAGEIEQLLYARYHVYKREEGEEHVGEP
jgi:tripeptidyl-peptidase I